jgi:predicted DCC family thiol-disulfide oxidoreductase YuxK
VIVLYDADCGFCRWAMAWAVRRDRHQMLVTVPIQSPLGCELLVDVFPSERLRSAQVVRDDGCRRSGGAAAADVLSVLPWTRTSQARSICRIKAGYTTRCRNGLIAAMYAAPNRPRGLT